MNKLRTGLMLSGLLLFLTRTIAQDKWDLRRCVDYAVANNISIKQSEVQAKISNVRYLQSYAGRLPTLNMGNSAGFQFGRSIDPVTNQFTNQQIGFYNTNLQTGVTLFNWFSVKNTIAANKLNTEADRAQTEKVKDDISLNVANAYLTALLSWEQMNIAAVTVGQTKEQLSNTRKRVDAGALPELNAAELEAQLARDSATYLVAESNRQLNLLQLKAILNLDAAMPFDIAKPPVELIPVESFGELQPDAVYQLALKNQPQQISNILRLSAAGKSIDAARGQMYPTLSAFGSLQTSFSSASKLPNGTPVVSVNPTTAYITVGGNPLFVQAPSVKYNSFKTVALFNQFGDNFRQSLGISLQVPIFNGRQARSNWETTKLNRESVVLQMVADSQTLKQNIYQAYQGAVSAFQTFTGRKKSVEASEYAFSLGKKRYDIGLLTVLDLVTLTNNLQRAKIDLASAQFDYVFRMKVLEFYKGRGIKL